jgi:MFS family permease
MTALPPLRPGTLRLGVLRIARPGMAAYGAMGVLWGSFAADLPDIKTMLNIDEAYLGALMFMTPIAAVAAMLLAPRVGAGLGRVALPVASLLMSLGFALPGQFSTLWLFAAAMMVCGAGTGLTDVLMNARVSALEQAHGRPLMNLTYAAYSFGYAGGAIATGALRSADWSPAWVFGAMALVAVLLSLCSYEADGRIGGLIRPKGTGAARLGWVPVIGGAMVLISFLTENAAENWSALHIEKNLGGSPAAGAMGPAVMAITMGVARLFGQGLALRVPAFWLLTGGALVSAMGALTAAMAGTPAVAYLGFIVMGAGSSVIAPTTFSLIGKMVAPQARARAVARATLLGYFGYFFGPPLIGAIAGQFGLSFAFVFAAAMLAGVPVLARMLRG